MYVKVTSGSVDTFPYTVGQLRRDNPQTSFPRQLSEDLLSEYGVHSVIESDPPVIDSRVQKNEQDTDPSLVNGNWTLGWTTVEKTLEETEAYDAEMAVLNRATRDSKLAETDFYALSDNTLTSEMSTYRQALRDISSHDNWPNLADDDWPTKP